MIAEMKKIEEMSTINLVNLWSIIQENIYEKRSKNMKHFLECNLVNPDVVSYLIMGNPVTIEL